MEKATSENRRLKDALNHVQQNYNTLQMQLMTVMHQQQQNDPIGGSPEVPRKFIDFGLASDEPSPERRTGRDVPLTPDKDVVGDEKSPETKSGRIGSSSRSVDQSGEATMRKARVSVRARSEAAMVRP